MGDMKLESKDPIGHHAPKQASILPEQLKERLIASLFFLIFS